MLLVTHLVICHVGGKDWIVVMTNGTDLWTFVEQINQVMVPTNHDKWSRFVVICETNILLITTST